MSTNPYVTCECADPLVGIDDNCAVCAKHYCPVCPSLRAQIAQLTKERDEALRQEQMAAAAYAEALANLKVAKEALGKIADR